MFVRRSFLVEGVVEDTGAEGVVDEEGKGVFESCELGMREQIREHFKIINRILAGEFTTRQGERMVHWDGPNVRPRISSGRGLRFLGWAVVIHQEGSGQVGSEVGL